MAHSPPSLAGPECKRPKGILKNSASFHRSPVLQATFTSTPEHIPLAPAARDSSRELTPDHLIERDIVLQNTLKNSGRRQSSSGSLRPSSQRLSTDASLNASDISPRLKWDEANLYLTEQERTPKMKIDEPKTPFAKGYDPREDEAELAMLESVERARRVTPDMNIPDLDLGEGATPMGLTRKDSVGQSPKQVVVKAECEDGEHHHDPEESQDTQEEEEKHKKFEEMRKRHYEMKNVANLLGHPEYLEEEDDDGDVQLKDRDADDSAPTNGVSVNGQKSD